MHLSYYTVGIAPTPLPGNEQGKPSADGKQTKTDQTGTGSATGDHGTALNIAALLLVALCAGGYIYRKKAKEENNL